MSSPIAPFLDDDLTVPYESLSRYKVALTELQVLTQKRADTIGAIINLAAVQLVVVGRRV
jgi:hypothetical protein